MKQYDILIIKIRGARHMYVASYFYTCRFPTDPAGVGRGMFTAVEIIVLVSYLRDQDQTLELLNYPGSAGPAPRSPHPRKLSVNLPW